MGRWPAVKEVGDQLPTYLLPFDMAVGSDIAS